MVVCLNASRCFGKVCSMSVLRNGEKSAVRAKNVNSRNAKRKERYKELAKEAKKKR